MAPFNTSNYFESGDELLLTSLSLRVELSADTCSSLFYNYLGKTPVSTPIWAIDAAKGKEGNKGIFFIDKNGIPVSSGTASLIITRSGKRNMSSTPVGSVTSLQNPLKTVSGAMRFVFDSTTQVVTAGAAAFKDFWRVDSSLYRKDTSYILSRLADSLTNMDVIPDDYVLGIMSKKGSHNPSYSNASPPTSILAYSHDFGGNGTGDTYKTWIHFNITSIIQQNSVITKARLFLYDFPGQLGPHGNFRNSNQSYLRELQGAWVKGSTINDFNAPFNETGNYKTDVPNQSLIPATTPGTTQYRNDTVNVTTITQEMLDNYYTSKYSTAMVFGLVDPTGTKGSSPYSELNYFNDYNVLTGLNGHVLGNRPFIETHYCLPCADGTKPAFSSTPIPGYYCSSQPVDSFICKPNIVDSAVNPYRWGILGNWRMNRAYTYYDARQQSDPSIATNIRKDGPIKAFAPYWSFGSGQLTASADTNRWVWNSEMTLFNRKGYEIENHDPLNRYNSGQYGYNQTMPVAAAQNAQNREMFFDGMEDYNYKTDTCLSCGTPRFINLQGGGTLVDTVSHTGRYSLRLGGNQSDTAVVKIASYAQDTVSPTLSIRLDSSFKVTTTVTGTGTGLPGTYINEANKTTCLLRTDPTINFNWGNGGPAGCPDDLFAIIWDGKIQPRYTDQYVFYCDRDDGIQMWIEDTLVMSQQAPWGKVNSANRPVTLTAGKLYHIHIEYNEVYGNAYINMQWASVSGLQPMELLPTSQLYGPTVTDASVASTIHSDTTSFCYIQRAPRPTRVTLDRFSPLQGKQMVLSAWIKEEQACIPTSYANSQVTVSFVGSSSTFTLKPTGRIIEGWQRVEDTLTIPATATSMKLTMKSTNSSVPVYFDDVRMHPFNTNIKSFVYDPVNLRLMAELDENNYATFYEYDDDGTLVRLKKETERGIKTIKETRSALIKD
jgi:hypothetical protein